MLELMKARHSVRQYKEQKKDLEKLRSKKGWRMLPLLLVSLLLVSCKGNEVNIKEVESETTEIYISYAGEIQQFDTNAGLVKNIENLIWLAPRGGLNMELVGEDVSEEYNPYIYESTHLEAEDSSDLIWVKILEDPSDSDKGEGTSVPEKKDTLAYIQQEDLYIAIQNSDLQWQLWKLAEYGDWLEKEIRIFLRVTTGMDFYEWLN